MLRTTLGQFLIAFLLCPSVWAGPLSIVSVTKTTAPTLTLEGLRQKYQSPYVVTEERTSQSTGMFRLYMPGISLDRAIEPNKGYIVKSSTTATFTGTAVTPTITIHPGFNLISAPDGLTSAQQVINELGLGLLAKVNAQGKFEAVTDSNGGDFAIEQGRGYLAMPKTRSHGTGTIFTEEDGFHVFHLKTMIEITSDQWSTPTTLGPFSSGDLDPCYTEDGKKVLFASSRGCSGTIGLFQVDADGSNLQRLTGTTPQGDCLSVLNYTPTPRTSGFKILLKGISSFPGSRSDIAVYPSPRGSSFTDPIFITSNRNEKCPIFSPDGQTIFFQADWDGTMKLYSVPTSIGTTTEFSDARRMAMATKLSNRPITADGLSAAPDGSVIFTSNGDIWCRSWDGTETNLTNTPEVNEKEASYSPDGSRICYIGADANGNFTQVCLMRGDGSGAHVIYAGGKQCSINHAWKP